MPVQKPLLGKQEYAKYRSSSVWRATRDRRLAAAEYRCEFRPTIGDWHPRRGYAYGDRCTNAVGLEVHHLTYERLGAERNEDLEVLCRFHHLVRHAFAVAEADCETCGDGPRSVDEDDVIAAVEDAVREAKGNVDLVGIEDIEDVGHCGYCER